MNSEELERSLKAEFESYLKNALAEMRGQISGLQEKLEAEVEKHKSQIDGVVREFTERLAADPELDEGFQESVVEHLKLSRDEGARITAEAIAEAEKMEEEAAAEPVSYAGLRDAISEITEQDSQADILKTLINHAAEFTPRGAFFIIKNEHFVGWRTFGKEASENDDAIREIYFPVSSETVLGESVRSLTTVESSYGSYDADADYLAKLDFGQPDRMYAIPLMARGRGVAVLYTDYGQEGTRIDIEALETLVRVAGLTVELLAATRRVKSEREEPKSTPRVESVSSEQTSYSEPDEASEQNEYSQTDSTAQTSFSSEQPQAFTDEQTMTDDFSPVSDSSGELEQTDEQFSADEYDSDYAPSIEYSDEAPTASFETSDSETTDWDSAPESTGNYEYSPQTEDSDSYTPVNNENDYSVSSDYQAPTTDFQMPTAEDFSSPAATDYGFEHDQSFEPAVSRSDSAVDYDNQTADAWSYQNNYAPADEEMESAGGYAPAVAEEPEISDSYNTEISEDSIPNFDHQVETVAAEQAASAAPVRTRFSDRTIDLPIEVPEDERRLHNDARRFARLLISEIKLYNEQKVKEGRDASDLYERLREAIDRSREMYDKRVQPPVAAKFDYFHYELVNTLAEGDDRRLGSGYPGALV